MRSIESFADLVAGLNEDYLADFLQVDLKTLRRWKRGTSKPPHAVTLLLRLKFEADLSALGGNAWEGFRMAGGKLSLPGWRGGFGPHEIRAMFFRVQQVSALEREIRARDIRIGELEQDLARETDRAERYRGLVKQESRWGMIWARVVS